MKKGVLFFTILSIVAPLALRGIELLLTPFAARLFTISPIIVADVILLSVAIAATFVCFTSGIALGFGTRNVRVDIWTGLLFVLILLPNLVMATVSSVDLYDFSNVTTAFSEELMCRGVWFSLVQKHLKHREQPLLSYPVLLSSLFFIVWHIPFQLNAPSIFYLIAGIYSSVMLGLLRERSRSLYPGILVHSLKLALL